MFADASSPRHHRLRPQFAGYGQARLSVESEFDVSIPDADITPAKFRSISTIATPVTALLAAYEVSIVRKIWSGRRESNPRMQLGKLPFCH